MLCITIALLLLWLFDDRLDGRVIILMAFVLTFVALPWIREL